MVLHPSILCIKFYQQLPLYHQNNNTYNFQYYFFNSIKYLILLRDGFSFFLIFSLLSLVGTSIKYSFLLVSSKYPIKQ